MDRWPRREFLKRSGIAGLSSLVTSRLLHGAAGALPNPVGYATISWPDGQLEHALDTISRLGYQGVQVLGWIREKYGNRLEYLRERLHSLNLKPVTLSCWDVNLKPEDPKDDVAQLQSYAAFFQKLGGAYLQVTDGGKPNGSYSSETLRQLGARMSVLGRIARDHGLELGYHPHAGTLGETREGIAQVLDATDPEQVKLIVDVGHLALSGIDPVEVLRSYGDRLLLAHFKDVSKEAAALARQGLARVRDRDYVFCEVGAGVVDFPAVVRTFREVSFKGWIVIELDGNKPGPGGPDASAKINRAAMKKLGFAI